MEDKKEKLYVVMSIHEGKYVLWGCPSGESFTPFHNKSPIPLANDLKESNGASFAVAMLQAGMPYVVPFDYETIQGLALTMYFCGGNCYGVIKNDKVGEAAWEQKINIR